MQPLRLAACVVMAASAAFVPVAARAADEPARLEESIDRAAKAAAAALHHGLKAAEHGVRVGAAAAARGIERGAQATARAAEKVARELERALPSPPPGGAAPGGHPVPGSERT